MVIKLLPIWYVPGQFLLVMDENSVKVDVSGFRK